jgi:hypothetical protein
MICVLLFATREAEVCVTTTKSQANIIFFLYFLAPGMHPVTTTPSNQESDAHSY